MAQDVASRSPTHPLIESDHVAGTAVYDADGKRIGTSKRLVIEKVSGHVAYAVTTLGGLLGLGAEVHSIPWEQLHTTRPCTGTKPASGRINCGMRPSSRARMKRFYPGTSGMNSADTTRSHLSSD